MIILLILWLQLLLISGAELYARDQLSGFIFDSQIQSLPSDISFCIIDLKYNKPNLKICEFGQGLESGFRGYEKLYGNQKLWKHFWVFINEFKSNVYLVDMKQSEHSKDGRFQNKNTSCYHNQIHIKNIKELEELCIQWSKKSKTNLESQQKNFPKNIIIPIKTSLMYRLTKTWISQYPDVLLLDYNTRPFVLNKLLMHLMFKDDPLVGYFRPECIIAEKSNISALSKIVLREIPATHFIIKPINSWKGKGIIICSRDDLDVILKRVFKSKNSKNRSDITHVDSDLLNFWQQDSKKYFMIESYEPSQPIVVNKKSYDATMRVAFGIAHNNGEIKISFFGCYWKLPKKSLNDTGTLEEKHKSHIDNRPDCSAKVDKKTEQEVYTILEKILPHIYLKMIAAHEDPTFISSIREKINS